MAPRAFRKRYKRTRGRRQLEDRAQARFLEGS
jgi:hypothetical protein